MTDNRNIKISGNVKNANISTGDNSYQKIGNVPQSAEPKKEWAGHLKLILQILATAATVGIAIIALYKLYLE